MRLQLMEHSGAEMYLREKKCAWGLIVGNQKELNVFTRAFRGHKGRRSKILSLSKI